VPSTKYPIICGWDPGSVNNAVVFMQNIVGAPNSPWIIFDEFVTINQKLPYTTLVPLVMRKMAYWNRKLGHEFKYIHISDNSAFNQFRAKTGSYDVKDIEAISRDKAETFNMDPIRMRACPKFNGSVESRVRVTIAKLQDDGLLLSTQCPAVKKMFRNLISEKQGKTYDPNLAYKPKRSVYVHAFDALSYVLLYHDAISSRFTQPATAEIMDIGT
jgi:hypothetical protein